MKGRVMFNSYLPLGSKIYKQTGSFLFQLPPTALILCKPAKGSQQTKYLDFLHCSWDLLAQLLTLPIAHMWTLLHGPPPREHRATASNPGLFITSDLRSSLPSEKEKIPHHHLSCFFGNYGFIKSKTWIEADKEQQLISMRFGEGPLEDCEEPKP